MAQINSFKKAFSLIELIIVINILLLVLWGTYLPYAYMQKKAKLRLGVKQISQTLYEVRNMAINGYSFSGSNRSIGLFLDAQNNPSLLQVFSYPFDSVVLFPEERGDIKKIKDFILPEGIVIENIDSQENALFFFEAISWSGTYSYFDSSHGINSFSDEIIPIEISYKNATNVNMRKELKYYTTTNIVDY